VIALSRGSRAKLDGLELVVKLALTVLHDEIRWDSGGGSQLSNPLDAASLGWDPRQHML